MTEEKAFIDNEDIIEYDNKSEVKSEVETISEIENNTETEDNNDAENDNTENSDIVENENVTNCLALTIKKEYKLVAIKNVFLKSIRMSWKVILSTIALNILKIFG